MYGYLRNQNPDNRISDTQCLCKKASVSVPVQATGFLLFLPILCMESEMAFPMANGELPFGRRLRGS